MDFYRDENSRLKAIIAGNNLHESVTKVNEEMSIKNSITQGMLFCFFLKNLTLIGEVFLFFVNKLKKNIYIIKVR
jgi:hypothetical protein